MRNLMAHEVVHVNGGYSLEENGPLGYDEPVLDGPLNTPGIDRWGDDPSQNPSSAGGEMTVAQGLALGAAALGAVGQVTRFVPGAQVFSAGASILGIGVGALAGAAQAYGI